MNGILDLKPGDKVLVRDSLTNWLERIFVCYYDGFVFTTFGENNIQHDTRLSKWSNWKIPEQKKWRPLTKDDNYKEILRDKWVKHKENKIEYKINSFNSPNSEFAFGSISLQDLFNNFTFLDDSIIGIEE